jgi:hypothetical protein
MEYGGESGNIAILEKAAEELRGKGYAVTVHKEYKERHGYTDEQCVEIVLRARKNFLPTG